MRGYFVLLGDEVQIHVQDIKNYTKGSGLEEVFELSGFWKGYDN
jgi:hypothetical protein